MSDPSAVRRFLLAEVEALEPFDFVAVVPTGRPLHLIEATRLEEGGLEVRVPGRPRFVPELPVKQRGALGAHQFKGEKPDDPTKPWTRAVESPEAAVDALFETLAEVFEEKPDAKLDIGHGSHKLEHEAQKKLDLTRTRIESIATDLCSGPPERDADGDFVLSIGEVHVMVAPRAMPDGEILTRIFAITNVGVTVSGELGLFLARLNFGMAFGRFALDVEHRAVWFDEMLLGEQFREKELRFAIEMVASTADQWDDRIKQMFGGVTYQEVLAGRSAEAPPPVKPGEGVGLYL